MRRLALMVLMITAPAVQAQVGLPTVRLPALPQAQLPDIDRALSTTVQTDGPALREVRHSRIRELIRHNRALLEADPNGAAIIRSEVLVVSPSQSELDAAQAAGFTILRARTLDALDARVLTLQVPQGVGTRHGLVRAHALMPSARLDFNHIYTDSGGFLAGDARTRSPSSEPRADPDTSADHSGKPRVIDNPADVSHSDGAPGGIERLGLIDEGIDVSHPVFKDVPIHQYGCGAGPDVGGRGTMGPPAREPGTGAVPGAKGTGGPVPGAHGTAIASLMVGRSVDFRGAAAGAELYTVDVYCGLPTGAAADAIADAFGWLARERVPVINVSLVGPRNAILETVIHLMIARGHLVVAAVGNDGPAAPPLYPASYPRVVGVTAVDTHRRVLFEAGRGPQVRFAAPGADMSAAKPSGGFALVRGTSFASPIVAGLLAGRLRAPDEAAAARAIDDLARSAIDLGAPGLDPTYGYGLVGADLAPEPRLARLNSH